MAQGERLIRSELERRYRPVAIVDGRRPVLTRVRVNEAPAADEAIAFIEARHATNAHDGAEVSDGDMEEGSAGTTRIIGYRDLDDEDAQRRIGVDERVSLVGAQGEAHRWTVAIVHGRAPRLIGIVVNEAALALDGDPRRGRPVVPRVDDRRGVARKITHEHVLRVVRVARKDVRAARRECDLRAVERDRLLEVLAIRRRST